MNYKSQLKGWAIDRVIELRKANNGVNAGPLTLEDVIKEADKLSAYAYQGDEDFNDTIQHIAGLLREDPENAIEKIDRLTIELGMLREDIENQSRRSVQ